MIEYWHILAIIAGAVCDIALLFAYIKWLRKAKCTEPLERSRRLSTFYKALAVVCFLPVVSPAYWISNNPLLWNAFSPLLPPAYHGAGFGMLFIFFSFFAAILGALCILAGFQLQNGRGEKLSIFVSAIFILSGIFSLVSLLLGFVSVVYAGKFKRGNCKYFFHLLSLNC